MSTMATHLDKDVSNNESLGISQIYNKKGLATYQFMSDETECESSSLGYIRMH